MVYMWEKGGGSEGRGVYSVRREEGVREEECIAGGVSGRKIDKLQQTRK